MEKIINELIEHLSSLKGSAQMKHGDLSDLGNEIGIVIGQHTGDKMGYEKHDFVSGVYHGISISDGTHGF